MSHSRNSSFGDGEGIPVKNVEFTTAIKQEEDNSRIRWMQQQQMYHARNSSGGSSLDTEAAAEYWNQWQQYYAAYGYPYAPGYQQGYERYQQQLSQQQQAQLQQQQPQQQQHPPQQQQQQALLMPPQGQQYMPWPDNGTGYPVPASQAPKSSSSPNSPGIYQSRKTGTSPNSPKLYPPPPSQQDLFVSTDAEATDVYAALLQGGGTSTYGSTHRKSNSRGSVNDLISPRTSVSGSLSKPMEQPPPPPTRRSVTEPSPPSHQRSQSDSVFPLHNSNRKLRRTNSGVPTDPLRRSRTASRGHSMTRSHRRNSSYASSGGFSVSSMVSIVSDIRKSTFYDAHNEAKDGRLAMHFPTAYVHLVPSKSRKQRLYQVPVNNEEYEAYHRVADDSFSWIGDDDEDDIEGGANVEYASKKKSCRCDCPHCATCQQKTKSALEPNYFLLTVPDNLYCSMMDEICAAREMPCGLFFCGHHEDVSRPSIGIAGVIVLLLFGAMGYAAYVLQA